MQGNGSRVPLGMDSRWRDERAGCTMITGTFGTTTREHQRKKETHQTWFTSTTRRSEYKYGIAMRTLRRACCWWLGDEERFEVVVLREGVVGVRVGDRRSMYYVPSSWVKSDDGSGTGRREETGRATQERHFH